MFPTTTSTAGISLAHIQSFFIIVTVVLAFMFIYTKHFAQFVSDLVHIMNKGFRKGEQEFGPFNERPDGFQGMIRRRCLLQVFYYFQGGVVQAVVCMIGPVKDEDDLGSHVLPYDKIVVTGDLPYQVDAAAGF